MLIQGGGRGRSPKVQAFCNSGGPDSDKSCGLIACPYSTSLCPYSREAKEQHSEMFRFGPQPTPCTVVVFGMFSGQRSTQGKGPSGEPRLGGFFFNLGGGGNCFFFWVFFCLGGDLLYLGGNYFFCLGFFLNLGGTFFFI